MSISVDDIEKYQLLNHLLYFSKGYHEISANVKIVPEITLSHPFFEQRLTSLDHQRAKPTNEEDQRKQDKLENLEATMTHWPAWVYRQYDPNRLAFKIRQHLQFIETSNISNNFQRLKRSILSLPNLNTLQIFLSKYFKIF